MSISWGVLLFDDNLSLVALLAQICVTHVLWFLFHREPKWPSKSAVNGDYLGEKTPISDCFWLFQWWNQIFTNFRGYKSVLKLSIFSLMIYRASSSSLCMCAVLLCCGEGNSRLCMARICNVTALTTSAGRHCVSDTLRLDVPLSLMATFCALSSQSPTAVGGSCTFYADLRQLFAMWGKWWRCG